MDQLPDIIGYPLAEALQICESSGYEIEIVVTRPVKATTEENPRVVRFNVVSTNKGVVTVAFEDIVRGGG
ncbi:hypothetical protein ACOBQJ_01725 [Pelotomaculum propionicicum]|uniref:hypothetical protein n=1 Tax=Pelotomaculum propionicicum TaxID=258475 RepID=UPI003B7E9965